MNVNTGQTLESVQGNSDFAYTRSRVRLMNGDIINGLIDLKTTISFDNDKYTKLAETDEIFYY